MPPSDVVVDRERLVDELEARFGGSETALRAVSRQARDLADSGRIEEDMEYQLAVEDVLSNLEDAPEEYTLVERWNWWIGSLELSFGDYQRFRVRPDLEETPE
jgi:hypothetical protein